MTRRQVDGVRRTGGHIGVGGGHVRAPHQPGRRSPTPHPRGDPQPGAPRRRHMGGARRHRAVPLGESGRLRLPGAAPTPPHRTAGGGLGAGPQRLPGNGRHPKSSCECSPNAPPRSKPTSPHGAARRPPRPGCKPTRRPAWPPGRHKDRRLTPAMLPARWDLEAAAVGLPTGQACSAASARRPAAGTARRLDRELFDRLVDPEIGLCAHDSRFSEAQVVEAVAARGRNVTVDRHHRPHPPLPAIRTGRTPVQPRPRRAGPRANGRPSPTATSRTTSSTTSRTSQRTTAGRRPHRGQRRHRRRPKLGRRPDRSSTALCRARPSAAGADRPRRARQDHHPGRRRRRRPAAGRPVLAVSTTNQAVDQLRQAGIPAVTVARFALDRTQLDPGTVVICRRVLPAAHPGSRHRPRRRRRLPTGRSGWSAIPTKPNRSAPADSPTGYRSEIRRRTARCRRRANRKPPPGRPRRATSPGRLPRAGDIATARPAQTTTAGSTTTRQRRRPRGHGRRRRGRHGRPRPERVAALAVTHADCEALADRIRAQLTEGAIAGPDLEGPGWAAPRRYQAGDRILLHAHSALPRRRQPAHQRHHRHRPRRQSRRPHRPPRRPDQP